MPSQSLIDRIDRILPQTQCGRCHFSGCRPYAEAIAATRADINRCAPGGQATIRLLADLLRLEPKALNPLHGQEVRVKVAVIVEDDCIGCAKCLQACPVDAIVGTRKMLHTVIASECTGCELCIEPCPVDCIVLKEVHHDDPRNQDMNSPTRQRVADRARARYAARNLRLERQKLESAVRIQRNKEAFQELRRTLRKSD
ncbi:MAG: electron transport complex subunit RsxB [Methylococcales bacterium]